MPKRRMRIFMRPLRSDLGALPLSSWEFMLKKLDCLRKFYARIAKLCNKAKERKHAEGDRERELVRKEFCF
jgi:hypothetical protein